MLLFCSTIFFAQERFSRLYNLEAGFNTGGNTFEIIDDKIFVPIIQICKADTQYCNSLSYFDFSGDLIETKLVRNFRVGNEKITLVRKDSIYLTAHVNGGDISKVYLLRTDKNFEDHKVSEFLKDDGFNYTNNGILEFNGSVYSYGDRLDTKDDKIYACVIKWNEDLTAVDTILNFFHGSLENNCFDLQPTLDGNLAFINRSRLSFSDFSFQITKIDTSGRELNFYEYERPHPFYYPGLLVTREGNFVVLTQEKKLDPFNATGANITMLNKTMDSILWSTLLPFHPIENIRDYFPIDYIQTQNGDIVVCGYMQWVATTLDENSENAFIARISPNGDLKWVKVYQIPNYIDVDFLEQNFRRTGLSQIRETDSGGFVAVGWGNQDYKDRQSTTDMWILSVDKNGCLFEENCEDIMVTTPTNDVEILPTTYVYPNPTESLITIDNTKGLKLFRITTIHGRICGAGKIVPEIDISYLSPGIYFIQLFDNNGYYQTHKIIKT